MTHPPTGSSNALSSIGAVLLLLGLLTGSVSASDPNALFILPDRTYVPVDIADYTNVTFDDILATFDAADYGVGGHDYTLSPPTRRRGVTRIGLTPYVVPLEGPDVWYPGSPLETGTFVLDMPLMIPGPSEVHTSINTYWGQAGEPSLVRVEFFGSDGAYYQQELLGGIHIRDVNPDNPVHRTTSPLTTQGTTFGRLNVGLDEPDWISLGALWNNDSQRIILPPEFLSQDLVRMRLTDAGAPEVQRAFLAGMTAVIPNPPGMGPTIDIDYSDTTMRSDLSGWTLEEDDTGGLVSLVQDDRPDAGPDDAVFRLHSPLGDPISLIPPELDLDYSTFTVHLSFDYRFQTPEGKLEILVGDSVVETLTSPGVMPDYIHYEGDFQAWSAQTLEFRLSADEDPTVLLDGLRINGTGYVPEPCSLVLMAAIALRAASRRHRRGSGLA